MVENVHGAMAAPVQLTVEHPLSMATVSIVIVVVIVVFIVNIVIIIIIVIIITR